MELIMKVTPSIDKLSKAYKKAGGYFRETVNEVLKEYAMLTERYAKQVTPVGTPASTHIKGYHGGRLRSSIGTELRDLEARVGTRNVKYAIFVHEGTRKMRSRPFLKWGFEFASKKFNGEEIADRLDKDLRKSLTKL